MNKLEILFYGLPIMILLLALAASPWLALAYIVNGILGHGLGVTHILSLAYVLILLLLLALVSPMFGKGRS